MKASPPTAAASLGVFRRRTRSETQPKKAPRDRAEKEQ